MSENKRTCPRCGWNMVRPSMPKPYESALRFLLIGPYRCRRCRHRFYGYWGFRNRVELAETRMLH